MLAAQAVDGNSSLGNVALVFEFGFWAGAVIPMGLGLMLHWQYRITQKDPKILEGRCCK